MVDKKPKNATLVLRLGSDLRDALDSVAIVTGRTLSDLGRTLIEEELIRTLPTMLAAHEARVAEAERNLQGLLGRLGAATELDG